MGFKDWRRILMVIVASLPLVQCSSGDGISSKIEFTFFPPSPVVILSDWTLNPGSNEERVISGPWFAVSYRITNGSSKTITIQSLLFTVTAMTLSGGSVTTTTTVDPVDYEDGFCVPHEPAYLEEIAPGQTVGPCFVVYVDALNKDVLNYSYQVEVSVQGWVGTPEAPEDRLTKISSFTTQ